MAAFNKFENFVEDLGKGVHQLHAAGHTLKVYLTNATPSVSLDAVKADLAEITAANGYPSGGTDVQNDATETGGTLTVTGVDVVSFALAMQHYRLVCDSGAFAFTGSPTMAILRVRQVPWSPPPDPTNWRGEQWANHPMRGIPIGGGLR